MLSKFKFISLIICFVLNNLLIFRFARQFSSISPSLTDCSRLDGRLQVDQPQHGVRGLHGSLRSGHGPGAAIHRLFGKCFELVIKSNCWHILFHRFSRCRFWRAPSVCSLPPTTRSQVLSWSSWSRWKSSPTRTGCCCWYRAWPTWSGHRWLVRKL